MEWPAWLSLAVVCMLGAMSPGPSLVVVVGSVLTGGRRHGVMTAIGHGIGVGFYALLTVLGLAVVVIHTPWLFDGIRYCGAMLLGYWGLRALLAGAASRWPVMPGNGRIGASPSKAMQRGFLVALLNPKLALFFVALFSQFVDVDAGWAGKALMILTASGIDMFWYLAVVMLLPRARLLPLLRSRAQLVEQISGCVLLLLAFQILIRSLG